MLTEDVGQAHSPETDASIDDKWIHDRDVEWLHQADVVVAEVTQPSLGVGYEIGIYDCMKCVWSHTAQFVGSKKA